VGQFGAWTPIAAEKTSSGYQVLWKNADNGQYTLWKTDTAGNTVSTAASFSGSSSSLKSLELDFQQDLNGDGIVGLSGAVIEAFGSTSLVQSGKNLYLNGSDGSSSQLKYSGAAVSADQFGAWTPIAAEKNAGGYQVVWKLSGADQYVVWSANSAGNVVSTTSALSGTSSTLKGLESSFQQDLNGDGSVGASNAGGSPSSVGLTNLSKGWNDTVTIKGVADANSQIKLFDGNTSLGTVTTAADGTWSYKTSSGVSDTVHTYTAQQIDGNGQVVGTSGGAILGSSGSNTLKSTAGNDIMVGGGQADTFVFAANFGRDVIKDFATSGSAQDTIQFSTTTFDSFASVLSHASQVDQDVVISSGNDTLTLKNTKLSSLNSGDFHFA
jgi:hypothetical protein